MGKKKESLTVEERLEKALVSDWEQPYKVPSNWVWTRLGEVCTFERGITFPASAKESIPSNGVIPCIRTANVQENLEIEDLIYVNKSYMKSNEAKLIKQNDIIMSSANSRELVGKTCFVKHVQNPMTFGGFVLNIRAKNIHSKFLFYMLRFEFLSGNFMGESTQTTNIANINTTKLSNYSFPLPPLEEQQRIVQRVENLFSKLDAAKEKAQTALDSFQYRKAAILYKAFSGELTSKWREENGVSLSSWEQIPFGELIQSGPQNGLYKPQSAYGSGIKIIRINSFYNGDIEPWSTIKQLQLVEAEINTYKLEVGDILVNRVNSMPYLGKSALVRELPEICVFESNIMRLSLDTKKALPEYIICYLNSSIGLEELKKNAKQAVNQASINQQDVKNAMISLPTVPEQVEIVRILDSIFEKERQAKELTSVIEKIEHMKKSILARAYRGELGTNNHEEDSALELIKEILSSEDKTKQKPNKKSITIPNRITKQFKTDLEEQIYKVILENQNSTLNQILSNISSSKHLDAMEVITILYEKGLINKKDDLYSTK